MNRYLELLGIMAITTLYACIGTSDNTDALAEEQIKTTLIEMWEAIENKDLGKYASYVHPEFTQFGETDPTLNVGKEIEVSGIKQWMQTSSNVHTEMNEPRVTVKGDVAWIVYYWNDNGTSNGVPFTSRGKSTRIFVKEEGKWLCIHGHYTLLPGQK